MIEVRLTQKVIKGELVVVPNLEDYASWDLALCLVKSPEGILTQRRIREAKLEKFVQGHRQGSPSSLEGYKVEAVEQCIPEGYVQART